MNEQIHEQPRRIEVEIPLGEMFIVVAISVMLGAMLAQMPACDGHRAVAAGAAAVGGVGDVGDESVRQVTQRGE